MRRVIVPVLLVVVAALGCGKQSAPAQRNQPQYDVVQEGENGSATSTISAPGETQQPTTATNNDTTGTFALGTAMPPANMPGGPANGVMPPQPQAQPAPMASGMPAPPPPPPRPRRQPQPIVVNTTTTDTSDTTETTNTAPPPPPPPTVTDTIGAHR